MEIKALGYALVGSSKIDEWASLATRLFGMQIGERSASALALRMDDRPQRLGITREIADGAFVLGWEVGAAADLQALAARLERAGVRVASGDASLAARRSVRGLITFRDPLGNQLEAFWGAQSDGQAFRPARAIAGFRTGDQGMGHAVLTVSSMEQALPFYRDVLGLQLSDYMLAPFKAYFFHVNARHHSLAMIETGRNGLHHLMVETVSVDDVGQGYDIALAEGGRISTTLGRHSNDFMMSFYAKTPSPCLVEYGWGGRVIDPGRWEAVKLDCGPSLWGHEREWLPPEQRAVAQQMRMKAAEDARRAPVYVLPGQYIEAQ